MGCSDRHRLMGHRGCVRTVEDSSRLHESVRIRGLDQRERQERPEGESTFQDTRRSGTILRSKRACESVSLLSETPGRRSKIFPCSASILTLSERSVDRVCPLHAMWSLEDFRGSIGFLCYLFAVGQILPSSAARC